jgi:hypothetical protein
VRHTRQEHPPHQFSEVLYLVSMCEATVVPSSGPDSYACFYSTVTHRPEFTGSKMSILSSLLKQKPYFISLVCKITRINHKLLNASKKAQH